MFSKPAYNGTYIRNDTHFLCRQMMKMWWIMVVDCVCVDVDDTLNALLRLVCIYVDFLIVPSTRCYQHCKKNTHFFAIFPYFHNIKRLMRIFRYAACDVCGVMHLANAFSTLFKNIWCIFTKVNDFCLLCVFCVCVCLRWNSQPKKLILEWTMVGKKKNSTFIWQHIPTTFLSRESTRKHKKKNARNNFRLNESVEVVFFRSANVICQQQSKSE